MDPRLAEALHGRPPGERELVLRVAQTIQRRGVVLHSRLVQLLRFLGEPSAAIRAAADALEVVGVVEVIPPGYQRRGVRYRWIGTAEPVVIDPRFVATRHERAIIAVLERARPDAICHSCLLRRVSPLGIRAPELRDFIFRARRFGLVELLRTAHGGRAYKWSGCPKQPFPFGAVI